MTEPKDDRPSSDDGHDELLEALGLEGAARRIFVQSLADHEITAGKLSRAERLQGLDKPQLVAAVCALVDEALGDAQKQHELETLLGLLGSDEYVSVQVQVRREPIFTRLAKNYDGELPCDTY